MIVEKEPPQEYRFSDDAEKIKVAIEVAKREIYETEGEKKTWQINKLISDVAGILNKEKMTGRGKLGRNIPEILGGEHGHEYFVDENIAYRPKDGEVVLVGDTHGDPEGIFSILEQTEFIEKMEKGDKKMKLVFLGDYIDRGKESLKTISLVLKLKRKYPGNIILLRGNHERKGQSIFSQPEEHSFVKELRGHFDKNQEGLLKFFRGESEAGEIFFNFHLLFEKLPSVLVAGNGLIAVHGGAPTDTVSSLKELNDKDILRQMQSNDPTKKYLGTADNPRGLGANTFGKDHFSIFMEKIGATVMARSHEVVFKRGGKIVSIMFDERLVTIFSNGGQRSVNSAYRGQAISPAFAWLSLKESITRWEDKHFQEIRYL